MKNNSCILVIILFFSTVCLYSQASDSVSIKNGAFAQGYGAVTQGMVMPMGNLELLIDPAYSGGLLFRTPYGESSFCRMSIDAAHLSVTTQPIELWFVRGRAGFDYQSFMGTFGAGMNLSFVRASSNGGVVTMLDDNESEFGLYGLFRIPSYQVWNIDLGAEVSWDTILTEPEYSHFLMVQLIAEVKLW